MEQIKLDYDALRIAVTRGDRANIEVEARKLRDRHIADQLVRAATAARSVIVATGRRVLTWRKPRYAVLSRP